MEPQRQIARVTLEADGAEHPHTLIAPPDSSLGDAFDESMLALAERLDVDLGNISLTNIDLAVLIPVTADQPLHPTGPCSGCQHLPTDMRVLAGDDPCSCVCHQVPWKLD